LEAESAGLFVKLWLALCTEIGKAMLARW